MQPTTKSSARSLRANLTDAGERLWARLRRKQLLDIQFYRQKPIGYYIADFYAPAARLIVEVDGSQHADLAQAERDKRRTAYFKEIGLRVLRFNDREVLVEIDSVTEEIFRAVEENPPKGGNRSRANPSSAVPVLPLFKKEG
ncbi:MAG TPA: endonuclease domain-containing protein [Candidatus Binatia bacterium]|nr:endonuclease domain-containing protein [Candidatus Binatia bacterium]